MEGLSRAVGAEATFTWKGKDYAVSPFTLGDWGFLEKVLVKKLRHQTIERAQELEEVLDPEDYQKLKDQSIQDAYKITEVGDDELTKHISTPSGMITFLWCIFERRFPGEFTKEEIIEMLDKKVITPDSLSVLQTNVSELQGSEGNEIGQDSETPLPPRENSATTA